MKSYKVIAFFAREHGLAALKDLVKDPAYKIVCVFTHSLYPKIDNRPGEERDEFKEFQKVAKAHNLKLIPINAKADRILIDQVFEETKDLDYILSLSWRRIIPNEHLDQARMGTLNLHRGKLPNYPGGEPIKQALNNGDRSVTISAHLMSEVFDEGKVVGEVTHPVALDKNKSLDENISDIKVQITPLFGPLLLSSLKKLHKIPTIFVDFDGTLFNTVGCLYKSYLEFLKHNGHTGTKQEFNELNGPSIPQILEILNKKYQLKSTVSDYEKLIQKNYGESAPFPDTKFFLEGLKAEGMPCYLVTSSSAELVLPLLEKYGLRRFFVDCIWGNSVSKSKPAPDIYLEALRRSHRLKEQVLVIEDSVNGVKSAQSAGLKVQALNLDFSKEELLKAGASEVFQDLTALFNTSIKAISKSLFPER